MSDAIPALTTSIIVSSGANSGSCRSRLTRIPAGRRGRRNRAWSLPARICISVVLPAPLGPTSPIRSPARTSNSRSWKTGSPANCRPRPCAEMRIMEVGSFSGCMSARPACTRGIDSARPRSLRIQSSPFGGSNYHPIRFDSVARPWKPSFVLAQRPLLAEHVVVVLREAVRLVADVLQQPQGERAAGEHDRVGPGRGCRSLPPAWPGR